MAVPCEKRVFTAGLNPYSPPTCMTPASVFPRFPAAAAALLLSAGALRAVDPPSPGLPDPNFLTSAGIGTVYASDYSPDVGNPVPVKVTIGGDKALGEYITPTGPLRADGFFFPTFGNAARIIFTIVPERVERTDGISQPNLLVGGQFDGGFGRVLNNNKNIQNITRILSDGSIDTGFVTNIGFGANNYVTSILPLEDGRIIVGGLFTAFNRRPFRRIVRLAQDGTPDTTFAVGLNIDNDVLAVAEGIAEDSNGTPDTTTLVAGLFNHVAGQTYGKLVRLDANGNLDMSFHPAINTRVVSLLVQPDGKIVIGGDFTTVNGVNVSHLARLNYDGSLDPTFNAGVSGVPNNDVNPVTVNVLKALPNGQGQVYIYVGGEFARINGTPRQYLGLLNPDGSVYAGFDPLKSVYNAVQSITIQSDDHNLLIGETLGPRIGNKYPPSLIRLIGVVP